MIQNIKTISEDKQTVMYFIRNTDGKIEVDSTEEIFKHNTAYKRMINAIIKKHNL